jgi:hypothetical protein
MQKGGLLFQLIRYFYSDCNGASKVVVTSPQPDSNLTIIGPRLLIAWPAGNSGVVSFFQPTNGVNGCYGLRQPSCVGTVTSNRHTFCILVP